MNVQSIIDYLKELKHELDKQKSNSKLTDAEKLIVFQNAETLNFAISNLIKYEKNISD